MNQFRKTKLLMIIMATFLAVVSPSNAQTSPDLRLNDFANTDRLTLSGSASVDDKNTLILTQSANWQAGSLFPSTQISMETFSTFFAFRISDPGSGGADGISLIAQTVSASLGKVGGGMGYEGVANSLAIEFDIWRNGWDKDDNHTGLLINGDVTHRDFPAVPLDRPLQDGSIRYVWIDYDGQTLSLRMSLTRQRPTHPVFAHDIDIPALLGRKTAFIGFAAATGAARAKHEILEWTYLDRFAPAEISESQDIAAQLSKENSVELDIQFEFNSDTPTTAGFTKIARFAEAVRQLYPDVPALNIIGHTDAVGSDAYNLALSQRRAASVRRVLVRAHGFPASVLSSSGMGERALRFPDAPNADGNRRVEIRLADATPTNPPIPRADPVFTKDIQGRYTPDGTCNQHPLLVVSDTSISFEDETTDLLTLRLWRNCVDCLPHIPTAPNERRIAPYLDTNNPDAAPVFRFTPGAVVIEPGGQLAALPELAAVVNAKTLTRCTPTPKATPAAPLTAPELAPTAQKSWVSFNTTRRRGASYCPILDTHAGNTACLSIGCDAGKPLDLDLTLNGAPAGFDTGSIETFNATLSIDRTPAVTLTFRKRADLQPNRYRATLHPGSEQRTLTALKRGTRATIRLSSPSQSGTFLLPLRGSSRALRGLLQTCNDRLILETPANTPTRFATATGPTQPKAEQIARQTLANDLAQMRQEANAPNIDVQTGWLVDAGDGWRFLFTEIGPSNYHFGMASFGIVVLAAPPAKTWRRVGPHASTGVFWIDLQQRNQGWPRLIFQGSRGVAPPFHAWRWDGAKYIHDRKLQ